MMTAEELQRKLQEKFPRLKWKVAQSEDLFFEGMPDGNFAIRAKIELENEGLVGFMVFLKEDTDRDDTVELIAEQMIRALADKILRDPLDVHKMKLVCT